MDTLALGRWVIEHDALATRAVYDVASGGAHGCECAYCRNFVAVRDREYPRGFLDLLSALGIGILTSTVARTQQQALFIIWFFLLFFLLLSGFFLPVENMPHWVQQVTLGNPVRWFMHVLREMFLKGSGFAELWREGLAMLAIGFAVFGLSLVKFSRQSV